jgi:hypothetical protein
VKVKGVGLVRKDKNLYLTICDYIAKSGQRSKQYIISTLEKRKNGYSNRKLKEAFSTLIEQGVIIDKSVKFERKTFWDYKVDEDKLKEFLELLEVEETKAETEKGLELNFRDLNNGATISTTYLALKNSDKVPCRTVYWENRRFIELDVIKTNFIRAGCEGFIKDQTANIYFKTFKVIDEQGKITKVKFIDILALYPLLKYVDDFGLFKWLDNNCGKNRNTYKLDLFMSTLNKLVGEVSALTQIKENIDNFDKLELDLRHDLENCEFNDEVILQIAKSIKNLRQERRGIKLNYAVLSIFRDFINIHKITTTCVHEELDLKLKKLITAYDTKLYKPRATDDFANSWQEKLKNE